MLRTGLVLAAPLPGPLGRRVRASLWARAATKFGSGIAIAHGATLTHGSCLSMGNDVKIDSGTFITSRGGTIEIGNRVMLNRDVYLNADTGGRLVIGDDVLIGPRVIARTCNHCFDDDTIPIALQGHECRDIEIGAGAWLGAGVILVPGAKVGEGTVVGAGSVVVGELPRHVVAVGNPVRIVRSRLPIQDS